MTDILQPKDERAPLELKGEWWLPSDKQKVLPGIMNFEIDGASDLELLGTFDNKDQTVDVIRGSCLPSRHVTLLQCISNGGSTNFGYGLYAEASRYRFIDAWVGEVGFNSQSEVMFDSYSFGMTNLDVWHFCRCFSIDKCKFGEPIVARYIPPKPVTLFADDNVKIDLVYQYRGPTEELVQNSSTIEHVPRIVIKSQRGRMPYYGKEKSFRYYEYRMATLLSLLIGTSATVYGRCGHVHATIKDSGGKSFETSYDIRCYNRRDFPAKLLKKLFFDNVFIPYSGISDSLQAIISRFFALSNDVVLILGRLAYFRSSEVAIPYAGVPELVFMFEGLSRNLYKGDLVLRAQMPGYSQNEEKRMKVKQLLASDSELSDWAYKRLKFGVPMLKRMFETARQRVEKAFLYCDDVEGFDDYVEYLRMKRDGFAHSEIKNAGHEKMDIPAYFWLQAFMIVVALIECGVDSRLIQDRITHCPDFKWAMDNYKAEFYTCQ